MYCEYGLLLWQIQLIHTMCFMCNMNKNEIQWLLTLRMESVMCNYAKLLKFLIKTGCSKCFSFHFAEGKRASN